MTQEQIDEYLQGDNPFKISKELLSEVLKVNVKEFKIEKNELRYIIENDTNNIPDLTYINIYELAHKCKEWACIQGYDCLSDTTIIGCCNSHLFKSGQFMNRSVCLESFLGNTEYESIFIACEWILDNEYS